MGTASTTGLGHLQQRVLSHLCWWQWEALCRKDAGAGYCAWSIPCPQLGGSHPRNHIPAYAFICLIQYHCTSAISDPFHTHPSPAQTNEPQVSPLPSQAAAWCPDGFGALPAAGGCCVCLLPGESPQEHPWAPRRWYSPAHLPCESPTVAPDPLWAL